VVETATLERLWRRKAPEGSNPFRSSIGSQMCNKCLARARGMEIVNLDLKIDKLFKKIEANPDDYKNDADLIRLMNKLAELIDKHNKLK
jgi:hypothetical protein